MSCEPHGSIIRELCKEEDAKSSEVIFKHGERVVIKGCMFMVQQICGDPHNTITFKKCGISEFAPEM